MFSKTFYFLIPLLVLVQRCFANDSLSTTMKNTFGITYRQRTVALNYERLLHKRFGVGCSVLPIYKDIDSNFRVKGALAEINARWYFLKMPVDEPTSGLYFSVNYLFGYLNSTFRYQALGNDYQNIKYPLPKIYTRNQYFDNLYLGLGVKKYLFLDKKLFLEFEVKGSLYKNRNFFDKDGFTLYIDDKGYENFKKYVCPYIALQFGLGYKF